MQVEELKNAVNSLPPDDYKKFRDWFSVHDSDQWDEQIERDIKSGKLSSLVEEALVEYSQGSVKEL